MEVLQTFVWRQAEPALLQTKVCKIYLQTLRNYILAILKDVTLKLCYLSDFKVLLSAALVNFCSQLYIKIQKFL